MAVRKRTLPDFEGKVLFYCTQNDTKVEKSRIKYNVFCFSFLYDKRNVY